MSVVSCQVNYAFPILVSDLAITTTNEKEPIHLPLINRPYHPSDFPTGRYPDSFLTKTIIIQGKLIAGFVGNVYDIERMVAEIQDFFLHREATYENVMSMKMDERFPKEYPEASMILLLNPRQTDKGTWIPLLRVGHWNTISTPICQALISAGSGASEWEKVFMEQALYQFDGRNVEVNAALGKTLLTCMYFMAEQRESPDSLREGWGGGFDIIHYENGVYKRLDNVAYVFWRFNLYDESRQFSPVSILRYSYYNDNLYIQHFNGDYKIYPISPIGSRLSIPPLEDNYNWETRMVCSCIYVMKGEEPYQRVFSVNQSEDEKPIMISLYNEGKLGFAFIPSLQDKLLEIIDSL